MWSNVNEQYIEGNFIIFKKRNKFGQMTNCGRIDAIL